MATLPADRSKLALAQSNQVPSAVASSSRNINAMTEAYDTIDALYNFTTGLLNAGTLSRLGVINVMDYNASGSAQTTTGSITSGLKALTVASAIDFAVGQGISIAGAGAAAAALNTTITAINGLVITLADAAGTTVSGVVVRHDDFVAISAAITAAKLINGEVVTPPGTYNFDGSFIIDKRITWKGSGDGSNTGNAKSGTVLKKYGSHIGIVLKTNDIILQDFLLDGASGNTGSGIEIGGSIDAEDAGGARLLRVSVSNQGNDGIWMRNGNCCDLDVVTNFNLGRGLRMESTYSTSNNVNANVIKLKNSVGNLSDGLYVKFSTVNQIWAVCQGNNGYGWNIDAPNNNIDGYTEGNVAGSAIFNTSGFDNRFSAKFNEGAPTFTNGNNFGILHMPSATKIMSGSTSFYRAMASSRSSLAVGTLAAGATTDKTIINIFGARAGDAVAYSPDGAIEAGIVTQAWVSANDTVTIRFTNVTAGSIAVTTRLWRADVTCRVIAIP